MAIVTDSTTIENIQAAYNAGNWGVAYQLVFDALTVITPADGQPGSVSTQSPIEGVDRAVWLWIAGARNVNSATGAFANYIRQYTTEQYRLRTGNEPPSSGPGSVQDASDTIARRFIADLFGLLANPDGPTPTAITGTFASLSIPDISRIGQIDAGAAASRIFAATTSDGQDNYSPWAGTLLFTRLGDASFFQNWVLTTAKTEFKREEGTYDLASIAKSAYDQGGLSFLLSMLFAGEVAVGFDVQSLGASAVETAKAAATAFFNQVYGSTGGLIDIGTDIFSTTGLAPSATYIVGTTGSDSALAAVDGSVFLNAGRGDDTIIGALDPASAAGFAAVIDGGEGDDTIEYRGVNLPLRVTFDDKGQFGLRAIVEKNPDAGGTKDYIYQVETIKLGAGADTVVVKAGNDLSKFKKIDGGGQPADKMDVLDFSQFDKDVKITDDSIEAAGTKFENFEKIIFSDREDTIKVTSVAALSKLREIDGGGNPTGKYDTIDFSEIGSALTYSNGSMGGDKNGLKFTNIEKLIGSAQGDSFSLGKSTLQIVDGGGGNDILTGGSSKVTLIGGDGTDQLFAGGGGATLDGGVSNGEGDKYVGGKGTDVFVIGNGIHAKQGTDAKFNISNAGADDRLVLRLSDTLGGADASAWTKGVVLNGGIQSLDWAFDGVLITPKVKDPNHVIAVFSSVLVGATVTADSTGNYSSASVSSRSLQFARPEIGNFTAIYDWNKSASTLDIQITTAYGDFLVHVDGYQNGQLGLTFVDKNEPMSSLGGLIRNPASLLQSAWDGYNAAATSLVQSAQIVDLPSPGEPEAGTAQAVTPKLPGNGYVPEYGSSFDPSEGAAFGSDPNAHDPKNPKRAPFLNKNRNPLVKHDPLVFDLTGNGLHLTDVDLSSTYVDFTGSGFASRTGWVDQEAGILVNYDGSSTIGASTILGASSGDGFADLAGFDTNGDGQITTSDSAAASLRIWVDSNSDGVIESGELLSLSDAGIGSIALQAASASGVMNGNTISQTGSFTRTDGSTGDVYEVGFSTDPVITHVVLPDSFEVSAGALSLPALDGYGHVADLQVAMTESPSLEAAVLQLVLGSGQMTGSQFDAAFESLVEAWAGAAAIDPTSRGPLIDAKHMAVVEAFFGQTFAQANGPNASLDEDTAQAIENAYQSVIDAMKVRFVAGIPSAALANGLSPTEVAASPLSAIAGAIHYVASDDSVSVNFDQLVLAVFAAAPVSSADRQAYFDFTSRVIEALRVDLFSEDKIALSSALLSSAAAANLPIGWANQLVAEIESGHIVDAAMQGSVVFGSELNDVILASGSDQELSGQGGSDVYVYSAGDGNDVIRDGFGQSRLVLTDLNLTDVAITRVSGDVVLSVASTGKTLTIKDQLNGQNLQSISFADGTVLSQWELATLLNPPNEYDGTNGADVLVDPEYVSETYVLGEGDDAIHSTRTNGSTFVFRAGDGNDTYDVSDVAQSTNILSLLDTNPAGVSLSRHQADVVVTVLSTGETITLKSQVDDVNSGIAEIKFADGTIWNRTLILDTATVSTPGYQVILGTDDHTVYGDGEPHSYIYSASGGNDVINDYGNLSKLTFSDVPSTGISLSRPDGGNNLTITNLSTGKTIVIGGEFNQAGDGAMQTINFSDGVSWTVDQVEQMLLEQQSAANGGSVYGYDGKDDFIVAGNGDKYLNGRGGSNTYVYSSAGGNDTIDDAGGSGSSVIFTDIASTDATFTRQGASNDLIITSLATSRTVTIKGAFYPWNSIQTVRFADNVTYTSAQVRQALLDQASSANGGSIYGYGGINDILVAGPGDKYLNGEGGYDTYVYSAANGGNAVVDDGGVASALVLSDVASSDVVLSRPFAGDDLVITVVATGKTITVRGEVSEFGRGAMQTITFTDGVVWDRVQVEQILLNQASSAVGGSVYGYAGNDVIVAGLGDKYMSGGGGADTYIYSASGGNDIIEDRGNLSKLTLSNINVSDVSLTRNGDDVILHIASTGKSLTVRGQLAASASGTLVSITFADGTIWTAQDIVAITYNANDENITPAPDGAVVNPGLGNDVISVSGNGSDRILFAKGDGHDTLTNPGSGYNRNDTLELTNILRSEVVFTRSDNVLYIDIPSTGDQFKVNFQFWGDGSEIQGLSHIVFADGATMDRTAISAAVAAPPTSSEVILGTDDRSVSGDGQPHTYVYSSAGGNDIIDDANSHSSVRLSDIAPNGVTLSRDGGSDDLVLTVASTGKTITTRSVFNPFNSWETISFSDGTSWTVPQIRQMMQAQESAAVGGAVYGYNGSDDTIDAGLGDKHLIGMSGFDTYIYTSAGGDDVIDDDGGVLIMQDIASTGIALSRPNSGDSLIITVIATGKTVTLTNEFAQLNSGGLSVSFSDGVSWTKSDIINQLSGAGSGDYYYHLGDGQVTLGASVRGIRMGTGISASDVLFQTNSSGDLIIALRDNANDTITVSGALTVNAWGVSSSLGLILFDDGTSMNVGEPSVGQGAPITFTWIGNFNGFNLGNTAYGSNVFEVSASGNVGLPTFSNGFAATNTIKYAEGSGGVNVWTGSTSFGVLQFGASITKDDVLLQADGSDLIVRFRENSGDSILVHNDLASNASGTISSINKLQFSDGTTVDLGGSMPMTFTWIGNSNGFNLGNTAYGSNVFEVSASGNLGLPTFSNGFAATNTIKYAEGSGGVNVWTGSTSFGVLQFGAGINLADVLLQADHSDLIIKFRDNAGDSILVHNDLATNTGGTISSIDKLQFSDGTTVDLGSSMPMTFTWIGNSNGFNLGNTAYGSNVFEVSASGNVGLPTFSNGYAGTNTIKYAEGSGGLNVWTGSTSFGVLQFGAGITKDDVLLQTDGSDLIIKFRDNAGDNILVHNDLVTNAGAVSSSINKLQFSDGTAVDLGGSMPMTFTWTGNSNGFNLGNTAYGSNVFEVSASGNLGLPTFSNGFAAMNTIKYAGGSGGLNVWTGSTSFGVLQFGAGIAVNDVTLQHSDSDLLVQFANFASDNITVHNDISSSNGQYVSSITQMKFNDGAVLALGGAEPITVTWQGTAGSSVMGISYGANVFQMGGGVESFTGGDKSKGGSGNNIYVASANTGQASINPNEASGSTNELDFVGSITDENLWFSESGNDLKINLLGTSTSVTVNGWFSSGSNQLQEITAGGLKIDSQISQLVQAMATYSAATPGFDPTSSSLHALPSDTSLQNAVAAAWHA